MVRFIKPIAACVLPSWVGMTLLGAAGMYHNSSKAVTLFNINENTLVRAHGNTAVCAAHDDLTKLLVAVRRCRSYCHHTDDLDLGHRCYDGTPHICLLIRNAPRSCDLIILQLATC